MKSFRLGPYNAQTGTDSISGTGEWVKLVNIRVERAERFLCRGVVLGNPLVGLKVTKQILAGGPESDVLVDADLDAASQRMPWTSKTSGGPSLYQTPTAGAFEFELLLRCVQVINVYCKAADGPGSVAWEVGAQ